MREGRLQRSLYKRFRNIINRTGQWDNRQKDRMHESLDDLLESRAPHSFSMDSSGEFDCQFYNVGYLDLDAAITVSFVNAVPGQNMTFIVKHVADAAITWADPIKWPGGLEYTRSFVQDSVSIYSFNVDKNGDIHGRLAYDTDYTDVPDTSTDPNILWNSTPLTVYHFDPNGSSFSNLYFYENRPAGYYEGEPGVWTPGVATLDFVALGGSPGTGAYLVKWEQVSGPAPVSTTTAENVWGDFFRYNISVQDTVVDDTAVTTVLNVTMATDDGFGAPVAGTELTKQVTFHNGAGATNYFRDRFTEVIELPIDSVSHTPDNTDGLASGASWTVVTGSPIIQASTNELRGSGAGPHMCVVDSGMADCSIYAEFQFNNNDTGGAGIVFRYANPDSYHMLVLENAISAPKLAWYTKYSWGLNLVSSVDATPATPFSTSSHYLKVQLNGYLIVNLSMFSWNFETNQYLRTADLLIKEINSASSVNSNETRHGIYLGNGDATSTEIEIFDTEVGVVF